MTLLFSPEQIRAEQARRSLTSWCTYVDATYSVQSFHAEIARHLERAAREPVRLIVTLPPRHGKSTLISHLAPAWYLGNNPDKNVILTTYGADLSYSFSRKCRDALAEHGPAVFGVKVARDSASVAEWSVAKHKGGLVAAGIGGPITGKGADLLIVDDVFKNWEEAQSEAHREKVTEWWQSTARTRLHPNGSIVILLTRWHEDDLAGWLVSEAAHGGEKYEVINYPMIDDEDQLLWPGRYSREEVDRLRIAVGERVWTALYQGRPTPPTGALFKREWLQYYDDLPSRFTETITSWDLSFKGGSGADYVVGQCWGRHDGKLWLVDTVRGRWDFVTTVEQIRAFARKHITASKHLVEDKANGPAVISALREEILGIVAVNPKGTKESRAVACQGLFEAGNVVLPRRAPWLGAYVEELMTFPSGKHDDQVDATTQALSSLREAKHVKVMPLPRPSRVENL